MAVVKKNKSDPKTHYVDNKKFYTALLHYKQACDQAKLDHANQTPPIPEYIGECLYKIATRLSMKPNFVNYPFREEMVGDGLENCINYLHNFNPEKYENPFAYFTQIIYFAFLRRIEKEKKHLYIKHKTLQNFYLEGQLSDNQFGDDDHAVNINLDNEYMVNLVSTFDEKQEEKRKKSKARKLGLEKFEDE